MDRINEIRARYRKMETGIWEANADFIIHAKDDMRFMLWNDSTNENLFEIKDEAINDYRKTIKALTAELERYKALEREGSLVELPCKIGDTMFSIRWNIKNEKYEICISDIKNVRYDSVDGSVMVSDGERFHIWGKTAFPTEQAARDALGVIC